MIYLYQGWTSLMYAAYQQYTEEVKFVLEHEADVSADDVFG